MRVECPRLRCSKGRWTATGETNVNRFNRLRAELLCGECGSKFSSGLQDAIDACNVVRVAKGLDLVAFGFVAPIQPARPVGLTVPAPSLPMPIVPRHGGFASVGAMASRLASDFKAKQSGERDPGEDD